MKYISFILLVAALQSCKKFVDIDPAPDLIDTEALFNNDATAISAVNGVYVQMRESSPSLANGTLSIYNGLTADELKTTSSNLELDAFEKNSILPNSDVINRQLWNPSYKIIYRTNIILENLKKSTSLSTAVKNQLTGEMKVVRAMYYFYLTNIFGQVPLVTSSDYRENQGKSRNPEAEIYQQVITDLTDAGNLLTGSYPSAGKLRPNKFTAQALLSRAYLYSKNWVKAEAFSSEIINSGAYSLTTPLNDVFKKNSQETIWEIASPNETRNTVEGSFFIPFDASSVPEIYTSPSLITLFEVNDARMTNWLGSNLVGGTRYYFPFKYKINSSAPVEEYEIILRLAEQFLIRAEARVMLNNLTGAKADLDMIRTRASLPNSIANDLPALLEAIQKERQVELFAEWGHRWYDLKRTEKSDQVLSLLKGNTWQSTDKFYPLPHSEIQLNPFLVQNPGY